MCVCTCALMDVCDCACVCAYVYIQEQCNMTLFCLQVVRFVADRSCSNNVTILQVATLTPLVTSEAITNIISYLNTGT